MGDMSASMDHSGMDHSGMDHSGMDHSGMDHSAPPAKGSEGSCGANMPGMKSNSAPRLEVGPGIDMTVATPRTNLDDPGIGLRDNGRRVLSYADLHSVTGPVSADTQREITLHLTGHMGRYIWSFDGLKFSDAEPLLSL